MLVLQDMVAFLGEERAHDHLNLKAAGLSCPYGALAVDMGVSICLVRAHDDQSGSTAIERFDVAVHSATTIPMKSELFGAAPLFECAVEFPSDLLEHCATKYSAAPHNLATPV